MGATSFESIQKSVADGDLNGSSLLASKSSKHLLPTPSINCKSIPLPLNSSLTSQPTDRTMSHLAIVASVDRVTIIDSQTITVAPTGGGALLTLNFASPEAMMRASNAMSVVAAGGSPRSVRVPNAFATSAAPEAVNLVETEDETAAAKKPATNVEESVEEPAEEPKEADDEDDNDEASRDMLASDSEDEDDDDDNFNVDDLLDGVRRINDSVDSDESIEVYGLTQEF